MFIAGRMCVEDFGLRIPALSQDSNIIINCESLLSSHVLG